MYYTVRRVKGRWYAVGGKYSNDLWRLFGKPNRRDRMPSHSLIDADAFIRIRTVDTDYRGLERLPYSTVHAILKRATESLSIEDLKSAATACV